MAGGAPGGPTPNIYKPPFRSNNLTSPLGPRSWGAQGAGGARDQRVAVQTRARQAAQKAAAAKRTKVTKTPRTSAPGSDTSAAYVAPPTPNMTPEDVALSANYDPSQLNLTDNKKIAGLAGNIQLPNAGRYASAMANMQYGPAIQQTAGRIKGLIQALPGSLQALDTAFANVDAENARRQLTSPATSGQGVANLFGGQGGVGAAGAAAVAANQAVQANNTTANQIGQGNDEAAAADRRKADWATRIKLLSNMAVSQGRSDLAGLQLQKGAAQKGFYDQGLKTRQDMVSQAISNQGALNNQKIASATAGGILEQLGLTNEQKALLNKQLGITVANEPARQALALQGGKQQILTAAFNNRLNAQQAASKLTDTGVKSISEAWAKGGPDALTGMIFPPGAVNQDATTGRVTVFGDFNTYANKAVARIMQTLPESNRKKVKQYVQNVLAQTASASNQWVHKNGRWQRVAQPKAGK